MTFKTEERERQILKMRDEGKTLEEIGKEMGITRERVRQIEASARKKSTNGLVKNMDYYESLPDVTEIADIIVEYGKQAAKYDRYLRDPEVPALLKEDFSKKKSALLEQIHSLQFAIDMSVKGYILGHDDEDLQIYEDLIK